VDTAAILVSQDIADTQEFLDTQDTAVSLDTLDIQALQDTLVTLV